MDILQQRGELAASAGTESDLEIETVTVADVLSGRLKAGAFTVLCVPGGFAPNWDVRLGACGLQIIREFVESGGGFVGICAGAYLGSSAYLALKHAKDCVP